MKKIILYIALAIFLILALISFRIGKQAVNVRGQEKLKEQETMTTGLQQEKLGEPETVTTGSPAFPAKQTAQQFPLPKISPAITIIKPPAKENSSSFSESIKNKNQGKDADSSSSRSSPAVSEKESGTFSEEEGEDNSAVTKINKQPSEVESKEMNERGIIMY